MKKISITLILSFLIPGAGHIYIGSKIKGLILLCICILIRFLSSKVQLMSIATIIVILYSLIDSYKLFKALNEYESMIIE